MSTSDREVITYMAEDEFDLPRWSNSSHTSHLSLHPAHVAAAANSHYSLYGGHSAPSSHQQQLHHDPPRLSIPTSTTSSSSSSSRIPARLPHSLDSDSHEQSSSPMVNLSRTASVSTGARSGRRQQPDDLERAYPSDTPSSASTTSSLSRQHIPNPFYPSSVAAYQVSSSAPINPSSTPTTTDAYMYYPSSATTAPPPPAGNTNSSTSNPPPPSRRTTNNASPAAHHHSSHLDSYSQGISSSLYSNTNYPDYSSQQTPLSSYPPHIKEEAPDADMRSSPYLPQQSQPSQTPSYSSNHSYPSLDTHQLSVTAPSRPSSHSNPSSPFSHAHGQISHSQYYPSPQADQMVLEPPPRRRSVGFKRVRDVRELRPIVAAVPQGRRMDHAGNYIGVCFLLLSQVSCFLC